MTPESFLYLFAIFIGSFIRAVAPFIRKWMAGEIPDGWDHQYTATFLISYIVAILVTAFVYQQNPLDFTNGDTVFFKGLILGVTSTTIINEVKEWFFPNED